jgi:hypothetical protein
MLRGYFTLSGIFYRITPSFPLNLRGRKRGLLLALRITTIGMSSLCYKYKDLKNHLSFFEVPTCFSQETIPLFGKEGRGEIYKLKMISFALKIPVRSPFPKGDLFQPLSSL